MNITQFTMEEVRCFAERQQFEIRPLTFLVGENSTGKTTALGCFQVLADYLTQGEIDLNSDPYSMGVFKDLVRNSKIKNKTFTLGFSFRYKKEDVEWKVEFVEKERGIEPVAKSVTVKFTDGEVVFSVEDAREGGIGLSSFDQIQNQWCIDTVSFVLEVTDSPLSLFDRLIHIFAGESEDENALVRYLKKKEEHFGITWRRIGEGLAVFSTSPIRSRPERTYDPTRVYYDAEGSDVPEWLMHTKTTRKEVWESLKGQLVGFGNRSGLFQNIDVRNFDGSMGNPFQLKVKVRGPNSNIIDVGYGVSQILPILVRILDPPVSPRPLVGQPFFLLQQPEVHLHPRAQAEFSSLLTALATNEGRTFIVETHSDNMIDRARVEIRNGNIRPEDVSLIYLEPKGRIVKVHNISFDKMGNMEKVPPHYREFFLTETKRLMGFED